MRYVQINYGDNNNNESTVHRKKREYIFTYMFCARQSLRVNCGR